MAKVKNILGAIFNKNASQMRKIIFFKKKKDNQNTCGCAIISFLEETIKGKEKKLFINIKLNIKLIVLCT